MWNLTYGNRKCNEYEKIRVVDLTYLGSQNAFRKISHYKTWYRCKGA